MGGDILPLIIPNELTNGDGLCNVSIFGRRKWRYNIKY